MDILCTEVQAGNVLLVNGKEMRVSWTAQQFRRWSPRPGKVERGPWAWIFGSGMRLLCIPGTMLELKGGER